MAISAVGSNNPLIRQIGSMRSQMDDILSQLSTGKVSSTYGGLGVKRSVDIAFRQQLSQVEAFKSSSELVGLRISSISTAIDRFSVIADDMQAVLNPNGGEASGDGTTFDQSSARSALEEMIGLFNADVGGRYGFSGTSVTTKPVVELDLMLDGDATHAGLRQITDERRQADLGADGLGRLVLAPVAADTVTVSEDTGGIPFGFKLSAASGSLTNGTVSGPTGSPPSVSVALTGQPNAGETVKLELALPDGSKETITLTAEAAPGTGAAGTFAIGADPTETAENLRTALGDAIGTTAETSLAAASGLQAAREFFAVEGATPMRVDGPPFDTATGLVAGTSTDTVSWYVGDNDYSTDARDSVTARVDAGVTAAYGARANEEAFGNMMATLGSLLVADGTAQAEHGELAERAFQALSFPDGTQSLQDIQVELAAANSSVEQAEERHAVTKNSLLTSIDEIEGSDDNELGVYLLSLQNRLTATYQATAIMYQMSLTQYL